MSLQSYPRGTPTQAANPQVGAVRQEHLQMRGSPSQQNYGNQQWNAYQQQYQGQYSRFGNMSRPHSSQQQQQTGQGQYAR